MRYAEAIGLVNASIRVEAHAETGGRWLTGRLLEVDVRRGQEVAKIRVDGWNRDQWFRLSKIKHFHGAQKMDAARTAAASVATGAALSQAIKLLDGAGIKPEREDDGFTITTQGKAVERLAGKAPGSITDVPIIADTKTGSVKTENPSLTLFQGRATLPVVCPDCGIECDNAEAHRNHRCTAKPAPTPRPANREPAMIGRGTTGLVILDEKAGLVWCGAELGFQPDAEFRHARKFTGQDGQTVITRLTRTPPKPHSSRKPRLFWPEALRLVPEATALAILTDPARTFIPATKPIEAPALPTAATQGRDPTGDMLAAIHAAKADYAAAQKAAEEATAAADEAGKALESAKQAADQATAAALDAMAAAQALGEKLEAAKQALLAAI